MSIWLPDRSRRTRPAYRWLAREVLAAIEAGELRPGDRLPPQRDLALRLGLSVQTVGRACETLVRAGVISGEVGRGSFVKGAPAELRAPSFQRLDAGDRVIDLSMLTPVVGPEHMAAMAETLRALADRLPAAALVSFRPRKALEAHVAAALPWLAMGGLRVDAERVLPTNGATPALTVALMTAAAPGDLMLTEEMGHHTLKALARYLGLRIAGLRCDAEGVRPDAFAQACAAGAPRVLCLLPSGNGPLAAVMGADRRAELVRIARRHDVTIVENDAWGPLAPERPAPLAALAPERVFHVTGLSKCLLPGLRLGWLVVPEARAAAAFGRHLATNWMASALMAEVATRWLADGTARRLLDRQRASLARRNACAARLLDGLGWRGHPHGLHVWLPLPPGWDETALIDAARSRGVAVSAGSAFEIGPPPPRHRGLRVCLGAPAESELEAGLAILARLCRSRPEPDLPAV